MQLTDLSPMLYTALALFGSFSLLVGVLVFRERRKQIRASFVKEMLLFIRTTMKASVVTDIFHQDGPGLSKIGFTSPILAMVCTFPSEEYEDADEVRLLCTIEGVMYDAQHTLLRHKIWKGARLTSLSFSLSLDVGADAATRKKHGLAYVIDGRRDDAHISTIAGSLGEQLLTDLRHDEFFLQIFFAARARFSILRASGVGSTYRE